MEGSKLESMRRCYTCQAWVTGGQHGEPDHVIIKEQGVGVTARANPSGPAADHAVDPSPSSRFARRALTALACFLLLVLVGWWATSGRDSDEVPDPPLRTAHPNGGDGPAVSPTQEPSSEPTPDPTPSTDEEAIAALEAWVERDAATDPAPVRGQWVAVLSSKRVGISDPSQQDEPFTALDILRHFTALRDDPDFGSVVRLAAGSTGR
ncbi:hypothetical protein [Knoellia subterranea]|uniref:Uncharacterized protein n=1 Tax=Knoellia subterranea KCTC 19937 TaxID=1385521 RepID=A0A0A0JPR8_9MICO|nr:hypothetical protein [Knoellia subterranea]KGN37586.1 hypothetical protein N803_14005 [Knoellia subterranea KCTC 19937]